MPMISANTKHLYNILRWADIVKILYKCFVFTGMES